jgi:drug/metabolite transporter (DMT)-like permease
MGRVAMNGYHGAFALNYPVMTQGFTGAILFAAVGAILFSAKAVLIKLSYQYQADTETVLALRMLFSMPFFSAAIWWNKRSKNLESMRRGDIIQAIVLGFIGYYASSYLDFLGLQYISVGLERIILYLTPAFVLVISAMMLKKKIYGRQWVAMFVAYVGVILVFAHDVQLEGNQVILGSTLVLLGAVTYAIYLIYAGELVKRIGSIRLVAIASGSSTVFAVIQVLITNPSGMFVQPGQVYFFSLLNGSLCTFVPMLMIMVAVNRVGSGLTAQASVAGPIATVFLGWYFLNEKISVIQLIGMAIVLVSMAILLTINKFPGRPELVEAE